MYVSYPTVVLVVIILIIMIQGNNSPPSYYPQICTDGSHMDGNIAAEFTVSYNEHFMLLYKLNLITII